MLIRNGPMLPFRARERTSPPYEIKAKGTVGEIYFYDVIGDTWDGSGTTAKSFAADLKALGDVQTLNIFVNSPGGSVFDGVAIYNQLRRHKARKIVQVDGIAASIASVITMAGDEIRMASNAMQMIHDPWSIAMGTATDFRKVADSLDKVRDAILSTYVDRSTSTEAQLNAWMAAETWFTAQEAVDAGLADSVTEEVAIAALAKHDLSLFHHVPEPLAKAAEAAHADTEDTPIPYEGRPHSAVARMEARLHKLGIARQGHPA